MKKVITLLALIISFSFAGLQNASAQREMAQKANTPKPRANKVRPTPEVQTWTIMNQERTGIHQKIRFTRKNGCQKVESWSYIFGGAEKLTVQAGTAVAIGCPAIAQWENAPRDSLKLPGFIPDHMEYTDPAERKIRELALLEGFREVGELIGHDVRKYKPGLMQILEDFRFKTIMPILQNEMNKKALLQTRQGFFLYFEIESYITSTAAISQRP